VRADAGPASAVRNHVGSGSWPSSRRRRRLLIAAEGIAAGRRRFSSAKVRLQLQAHWHARVFKKEMPSKQILRFRISQLLRFGPLARLPTSPGRILQRDDDGMVDLARE